MRYLLLANCVLLFAQPARHPYVTSQPMPTPMLFGEGIISTPDYELNSTFTPDGQSVYFTKSTPAMTFWTIVVSHYRSGRWSEPEVAPFSGQYSDADPFIAPDGSRLVFLSRRPLPGKSEPSPQPHLWYVDRTPQGWGAPVFAGDALAGNAGEYFPSIAADGTLYFETIRPNGKGRNDVYRSKLVNGVYTEPENLGEPVNSPLNEGDAVIAPDQSFMILTISGHPAGKGNSDLFITEQKDGVWSAPRPLGGQVNSNAIEFCPILSPDGRYLFFTSTRGFGWEPLTRPLHYDELSSRLRGVLNGLGNIYQVDLAAVR